MKALLSCKACHIIFTSLLLFYFTTNSVAKVDANSPVQKDVAELKAFVDSALKYIKANGEEKAYKEFSNPNSKFRKGNLYIFVNSYSGKVLAHGGDPSVIGKNLFNAKDKFGTPFFQLFVEAVNRGGGIVSYYWPRPDTGVLQYKTSYVAPINDRAYIGAGVFKSLEVQPSQEIKINALKQFVNSGIEYVKQKGAKEAYKEFNNTQGKFVKDDWYIFVINYNGEILAHGGDPKKMVGSSITALQDEFGTQLLLMFTEAAKNGSGVISYYWPDYAKNGTVRFKTAYVASLDKDTFIGAGFYGD
jgi:cytochrome c